MQRLDDCHFDLGGLGDVYHICQFAEIMERNGSTAYPEIQTQDDTGAWKLGSKGYIAIQSTDEGWDYTIYNSDYSIMDGGQLDAPELTIQEAREQILEAHHMEKGQRTLQDYDLVMDKVGTNRKEVPDMMSMLKKIVLFPISLFVAFLALMAKWLLTLSSYVVAPLMLYIFGCGIYTAYRQTWDQFFILLVAEFICFVLFFGATAITEGIGRFSEWLAEL